MKKLLSIIILLFFQNVFCQEYHFDNFLEYKELTSVSNCLYFYNSTDDNYKLTVVPMDGIYIGRIYDKKNKIIHEHKVINDGNSIKFNYQYSIKWNTKHHTENYFKISEKEIDSLKTLVSVLIYQNKKKKEDRGKIELIIENSNLFNNVELINSFTDGIFPNNQSQIIRGTPINIRFLNSDLNGNYTLIRKEKISTILTISNIKKIHPNEKIRKHRK